MSFSIPKYLSLALLLALPALFQAQGLLLDDERYEILPRQPLYGEGSKAESEALRGIAKADLKPYCPTPQDQGYIGSCTGWSTGYGAFTILNAIRNKMAGKTAEITRDAMSALFIYNQVRKGSCDFGAYISDAAGFLVKTGDIFSRDFDRIKNDCEKTAGDEDKENAAQNRIRDYVTLFAPNDPATVKIQKTKLSLAQNKPVIIGMKLYKNFQRITSKDEYWYPAKGDTSLLGAHAMVVIGFDDGREAFELMNSWGVNWGNSGFIWVKYKDFGRFCQYAVQLIPDDGHLSGKEYKSAVTIRRPGYDEDNNLQFTDLDLRYNNGYYDLRAGALKKGDLLQPLVKYITADMYLYAFSFDAGRKVKVHWPRDETLDSKYDGKHESAVVSIADVNLPIPGPYGALSFSNPGTEYICFLVSKSPIDNFNGYLSKLQSYSKGDFLTNLQKAFGKQMEPVSDVQYDAAEIQAQSGLKKGGIMPVVVRVNVR